MRLLGLHVCQEHQSNRERPLLERARNVYFFKFLENCKFFVESQFISVFASVLASYYIFYIMLLSPDHKELHLVKTFLTNKAKCNIIHVSFFQILSSCCLTLLQTISQNPFITISFIILKGLLDTKRSNKKRQPYLISTIEMRVFGTEKT